MADRYEIAEGSKIDFHLQGDIYMASCDGMTFGVAKTMVDGNQEDLDRLGSDFSGVVIRSDSLWRLLEVKVKIQKGRKMPWNRNN